MKKILTLLLFLLSIISATNAQNFNVTFRGEINYPYSGASIWGYVDDDGTEYALVGTFDGVSIVDVSDPDNPEVKFNVSHTDNLWREIKTYGHYAYATNEAGGGLLIINLANLPASVETSTFSYTDENGNTQDTGHTLWIDESGRLFIFGGSYGVGGATIYNLAANPLNPPFLGKYQQQYIHDGFVRGDTLWASEIWAGQLEMVDVSNPAVPVPMASVNTPNFFTHNAWPTSDNHYVFTTDEVDDSYLTSYDVSDFDNITELDREQSNPGSNSMIHNVHLYNDQFAWTAYYKDGVVLFDVSRPDNIVEVASYDTDPQESGGGSGGTWGVYPYLPSGNIIVSDLYTATTNGKLTILTPDYVAACWLEGNVTDAVTGSAVNNAYAEILTTTQFDYADLGGVYKTGVGVSGTYTVRFSKTGYVTKEIPGVSLTSGIVTDLDVQLAPLTSATITGTVSDSATNELLANAHIYLRGINNGLSYDITTDVNGAFNITSVLEDVYDAYAGKWGYHETALYSTLLNQTSGSVDFKISKGYYDDFIVNNEWLVTGNASSGIWERGEPIGTFSNSGTYNPENDVTGDFGDFCFVTGNGGGSASLDDVDNGTTTLTSPIMDLSGYDNPVISFYARFANGGGNGGTPNDTLSVFLTNGITTVKMENIKNPMFQWKYHEYPVLNFLTPSSAMQVIFSTTDDSTGHLVEAAIDKFQVINGVATGISQGVQTISCSASPNPFTDESTIQFDFGNHTFSSAAVNIYSILGQQVEMHEIKSASGTISWGSKLTEGIYLVKVLIDGETKSVMKVVKVK